MEDTEKRIKNLTPEHMRCEIGASCPSLHQLEDGRLLIVGDRAKTDLRGPFAEQKLVAVDAGAVVGRDEHAIVIDPELLVEYVAGKVTEMMRSVDLAATASARANGEITEEEWIMSSPERETPND